MVSRYLLAAISEEIEKVTRKIAEFDEIEALEDNIGKLFLEMSGPRQDIKPRLGFSGTDPTRLYRNIKLLIDDGVRGISDASLGSANLVFLSLKALELKHMIDENTRDHTFLAIEEPEAHLHPHESPHFSATLKSPTLGSPCWGMEESSGGGLCARRRNGLI